MTGKIVKEISLNSFPSKKINLKFSKKKNQKPSNNKMSLKYLLSNNPDSKKKLSLLLEKPKKNDISKSEIIVQKKESEHSNKNNNHESKFNYQKKNTVIDYQNSNKRDKKLILGGNIPEQKSKLNNILSVVSSPTDKVLTETKKGNLKENQLLNKKSFQDSNKLKNKYGGNQDKIKLSNEIIKMENSNHLKVIPDKRQFSKISGDHNVVNHDVKKKTSNRSSKKTKVISLDIEKPKKSNNGKRTKFIHKVNSLQKKEIKQILVRNNLIKDNSKAPENLMKNILIDSVELGVNLV